MRMRGAIVGAEGNSRSGGSAASWSGSACCWCCSLPTIIHPVRQIESRILSLGAGVELDQRPVDGSGRTGAAGEWINWLHDKLKELEQQKYQFLRATYPTS